MAIKFPLKSQNCMKMHYFASIHFEQQFFNVFSVVVISIIIDSQVLALLNMRIVLFIYINAF